MSGIIVKVIVLPAADPSVVLMLTTTSRWIALDLDISLTQIVTKPLSSLTTGEETLRDTFTKSIDKRVVIFKGEY